MKKIILGLAMILVAFVSTAQETKFGVKAGANYASAIGSDSDGSDGRIAYHFGGFAQIGITEKFAIQPELLYSLQGAQSEDDSDLKADFSYLNLPILAKIYATEGLSFYAGPQFGLLLSAKEDVFTKDDDIDVKDASKSIDISGVFGTEYELAAGIRFGARYNLGLTKVSDDKAVVLNPVTGQTTTIDFEAPDTRNGVFQLYLGFSF